jgi:hypothetical protein
MLTLPPLKRVLVGGGQRDAPSSLEFNRARMAQKLEASDLKKEKATLAFMLRFVDESGWTCISRIRIAEGTGVNTRTVQRHWAIAREKGYLVSYDYQATLRRTSDHWLMWPGMWPSGDPGLRALAAHFPSNMDYNFQFVCSLDPPPF